MKLGDRIQTLLKSKPSNTVLSVRPDQSVFEAIEKMAEQGVGALLILDNEQLLGIITERDYARKVILRGRSSKDTRVRDIMTSPVVFVTPQQSVDDCMTLMTVHHFRHLPVVDEEKVVGVVSIGDLVKWIITGQERAIQQLESYISGTYPG
jgi:CBS domain-containing protein